MQVTYSCQPVTMWYSHRSDFGCARLAMGVCNEGLMQAVKHHGEFESLGAHMIGSSPDTCLPNERLMQAAEQTCELESTAIEHGWHAVLQSPTCAGFR